MVSIMAKTGKRDDMGYDKGYDKGCGKGYDMYGKISRKGCGKGYSKTMAKL